MANWYRGHQILVSKPVITIRTRWTCPIEGCGGEMFFNGAVWPMSDPGYHHSCNKCKFETAITGHKYPEVTFEDK